MFDEAREEAGENNTLKVVLHSLPPEPVDDEISMVTSLQSPTAEGRDITSTGDTGLVGLATTMNWPVFFAL